MAMERNIQAALRDLAKILAKLKELSEWAKLERQERRPHAPPSFQLSNHVEDDVRVQYAAFVSTTMEIQGALNDPTLGLPEAKRSRWQRRLQQIEAELRQTDLPEKFIRL